VAALRDRLSQMVWQATSLRFAGAGLESGRPSFAAVASLRRKLLKDQDFDGVKALHEVVTGAAPLPGRLGEPNICLY
jgi:uncharacterized membrane protein YhhN